MATTISVSIQKGGSGKTTTTLSISSYLASKGFKVLVVDLDAQCNTTLVLADGDYRDLRPESTVCRMLDDDFFQSADISQILYKTKRENLFLIPSHSDLSSAEVDLASKFSPEQRLSRVLESAGNYFDYVFIDCPPNLGRLPVNAYLASDFVLIPVSPNIFDFDGLNKLLETINKVALLNRSDVKVLGLILNKYDTHTSISKEIYTALREKYGELLFEMRIPKYTDFEKANLTKQDIFQYDANSQAAITIQSFVEKQFLPRLKTYEQNK